MFSPEEIKKKKILFLEELSNTDKKKIEFETRNQSKSDIWYNERRIRLTASRFGQICKMRPNTSCKNLVYSILYASNILYSKSLEYGKEMEAIARKKFEEVIKIKVYDSGLVIDPEFPFLAASPGNLPYTSLLPY